MKRNLSGKKRVIVKIGSSSLTHKYTGYLNLRTVEKLARILCDLRNQGMDVALVSSGAIAVGRQSMGFVNRPDTTAQKQALAAIGQAKLMMTYEKIFAEYQQAIAQLLLTKDTMLNDESRENARNTFEELFSMGVVPIINENDTVATHEIEFGDNDRLSAIVAALVEADLVILLTDIDGLYTANPHKDPTAERIALVPEITDEIFCMGTGESSSAVGTGGMAAKLVAARMATDSGADMVIANGGDVENIYRILDGEDVGTLFLAHKSQDFDLIKYMMEY